MDLTLARSLSADIQVLSAQLTAALLDAPVATVVKAGDNLQAAIDAGGPIELEAGAAFTGTYTLRTGTRLKGRGGNRIVGSSGPALDVRPGSNDIAVDRLELGTGYNEVVSLGRNDDTQTTLESAPYNITFSNVTVPTHRNKRVFAIHAGYVALLDCEVLDAYDPAGQDSQAVYIGNSPGDVRISGGRYSAGSEIILCGGDTTRIPGIVPTNLTIEDVELFRPLSWMTDGVARKVKNIFELKSGKNVILRRSNLHGCWANGQQGEAIVLTPALDGAKTPTLQSGTITNVLMEDLTITECASVFNLQGRAYTCWTDPAMSGVVAQRISADVSRAKFGGRGQLALISGEPNDILFDGITLTNDGTSLVYYSPGTVIDPVTKLSRAAGKLGALTMRNCRGNLGLYGFMLGGYANAANWSQNVGTLAVDGNTFTGSTAMRTLFPNNTYLG